jgi:DNA-binding IclR family transcriptional regulator
LSAILRNLDIVMFVAQSSHPVTANEVATCTGQSRTTVFRALDALHRHGWLRANGSPRSFSASFRLAEIGIAVLRNNHIRDVLVPYTVELARQTQHFCSIAFYEDGEVVHTDAVLNISEKVFAALSGVRYPVTAAAAGKILLAYQPPEEIERVLAGKIAKPAKLSKTDPEEIRKDIDICRARGYGLSDKELTDDNLGIAVPVFDAKSDAVAALSVNVLGPIEGDVAELSREARSVAMRASIELGFRPRVAKMLP